MCSLMDYKPKQNGHKKDQDQDQVENILLEESPITQTDEDDVIKEYVGGIIKWETFILSLQYLALLGIQ